jgi:hypothetical protein
VGEQARSIFEQLCRESPARTQYRVELSNAWEQIGKARWDLGHRSEALLALRKSAAVMKEVLDEAPSDRAHRIKLSRCYDRLAYWSGLLGDWAEVGAALLAREKLWPDDDRELREVAKDLREAAEAIGRGKQRLTPEEQAHQTCFLAQSDRVRRVAEAAARRVERVSQSAGDSGPR